MEQKYEFIGSGKKWQQCGTKSKFTKKKESEKKQINEEKIPASTSL